MAPVPVLVPEFPPQLFTATVPNALLVELEASGLAKLRTTLMNGAVSLEIRFSAAASTYVAPLFTPAH